MGRLSDRTARTVGPGRHGDGDGLALVVSEPGSRKWVLRCQRAGKRRDMGLGSYPEFGLSAARAAAANARSLIAQGKDPLAQREENRKAARPVPTFGEIAAKVTAEARAKTSNAKVAYQWERHLGPAYSSALLDRPVNEITTLDVADVCAFQFLRSNDPIWSTMVQTYMMGERPPTFDPMAWNSDPTRLPYGMQLSDSRDGPSPCCAGSRSFGHTCASG